MNLFGKSNSNEIQELQERLDREKKIRSEAERLLEEKSREVYLANQFLKEEKEKVEKANVDLLEKQEEIVAQEEELRQTVEELLSMNEELEKIKRQLTASNESLKESEHILEQKVETRTQELLLAKNAAERANKVKSEFLANMSHELRTPLNGILGYAQILQTQDSIPSEHREKIKIIKKCGDHLLQLINSVLDLSKIEAGMMKLTLKDFELTSLTKSLYEIFAVQCKSRNLSLNFDVHATTPKYIHADEQKLKQCLINIIGNAVKFTDKGGVKVIISSPAQNRLQFIIEDTGRGIPADKVKDVLRPFEQVTKHQNTEGGTGLGLSITNSFIELMGGKMQLTSQENVGTTITFDISISVVDTISSITESNDAHIIGYTYERTIKILIVDDNEVNVNVAEQILQPLYFETNFAVNGSDAIQKFIEFQPDLILMDIRMPVMDGLQATQIIRNMNNGKQTKIIAVTAHAFEDERSVFLDTGCDDVLIKPYQKEDLLNKIKSQLDFKFVYATTKEQDATPSLEPIVSENQELDWGQVVQILGEDLINQIGDCIDSARLDAIRKHLDSIPESQIINSLKTFIYPLLDDMNFDALDQVMVHLRNPVAESNPS